MTENPYYQYFIELLGYQEETPIDSSTLVLFRKRLKMHVIMEANEYMLDALKEKEVSDKKDDDHTHPEVELMRRKPNQSSKNLKTKELLF